MRCRVHDVVVATGGRLVAGTPDVELTSVAVDSRLVEPGGCFVALRDRRDGHEFVADAVARGARAALVDQPVSAPPGVAVVVVEDGLAALGALGAMARTRLGDPLVVGVTGSAGKTATKDLTAAAFARSRRVHASPGSFNNDIGVPLTFLGAAADTEVVVTEMGARAVGDIARLCSIARPHAGVVTNIGLAHAGSFGDRSGVAAAKGELVEALAADGVAVLDADDDHSRALAGRTLARVLLVGWGRGADVRVHDVALDAELRASFRLSTPWGAMDVRLGLRGEHQAVNAAMGAAVALAFGAPIDAVAAGLGDVTGTAWRMQLDRSPDGVVVLNDAYNASPISMAAALRALGQIPAGRRVAVLGEMCELGTHTEREHAALGRFAGEAGVDLLVTVGDTAAIAADPARAAGVEVHTVPDPGAALALLGTVLTGGDAVLVKASRAVGLEAVAEALVRGGVRA
jgi:UDP-N-acetylmuramoyl-tripeptide--D-alanyl-D-alanine ligase